MIDRTKLQALLERLDGSGSEDEWSSVDQLHALGKRLPTLLLEQYRRSRRWQARSSCVYHAINLRPAALTPLALDVHQKKYILSIDAAQETGRATPKKDKDLARRRLPEVEGEA